eukprot:GHVR01157529.1.p1 GENE.GHVR01157529.1~~GHVR01157529.1.p1  ORF type:complete len:504 (+),score=81.88 GHVR01157529.1:27-1538(+)
MMMMQISIYISVLIVGYTSAEPNIYEQISDQLSRPILFYNDIEEQRPSASNLRYENTPVPPLSYRRNAFTMILKNERSKELMFKCVLNEDTSDIYMTLPRNLYEKDFYTHAGCKEIRQDKGNNGLPYNNNNDNDNNDNNDKDNDDDDDETDSEKKEAKYNIIFECKKTHNFFYRKKTVTLHIEILESSTAMTTCMIGIAGSTDKNNMFYDKVFKFSKDQRVNTGGSDRIHETYINESYIYETNNNESYNNETNNNEIYNNKAYNGLMLIITDKKNKWFWKRKKNHENDTNHDINIRVNNCWQRCFEDCKENNAFDVPNINYTVAFDMSYPSTLIELQMFNEVFKSLPSACRKNDTVKEHLLEGITNNKYHVSESFINCLKTINVPMKLSFTTENGVKLKFSGPLVDEVLLQKLINYLEEKKIKTHLIQIETTDINPWMIRVRPEKVEDQKTHARVIIGSKMLEDKSFNKKGEFLHFYTPILSNTLKSSQYIFNIKISNSVLEQ